MLTAIRKNKRCYKAAPDSCSCMHAYAVARRNFAFRVSHSGFRISRLSCTQEFRVSGFAFRFRVSRFAFAFRVSRSRFGFRISRFGFRISGCAFRVSCFTFRIQVSRFGLRISGFVFHVSRSDFRVSRLSCTQEFCVQRFAFR